MGKAFRSIIILLACAALAAPATASDLPDYAREYVAGNFFNGTDPSDPAIDAAVQVLRIPTEMRRDISGVEWEAGQLNNFANDKLYILVDCPDGSSHAVMFRDGKKRNDRTLDESRADVLRRLYSPEIFELPPDQNCQVWLDRQDVDSEDVWQRTLAASQPQWDAETLKRAHGNYTADGTATEQLARGLGALLDSSYAEQSAWAAIWLVSRMDAMSFRREDDSLSVPDLQAVTARQFYENVWYAVLARNEFPWAKQVSDEDFLQQVLSPRGSGEPLQRWRRQFYVALLAAVQGLGPADTQRAIEVARNAYADYFQYEGDTTWEDFGMLTSLAVHEGRCEDCSNVENAMLRTLGIPGCQAYTPWWGHQDGNHAWTWVRGIGDPPGDGRNGVKIYVKTWDGNEDVTAAYTPVTEIRVPDRAPGSVHLMVWNSDDWRRLCSTEAVDGEAVFPDVGCRLSQALCFRQDGQPDMVCDLRPDGSYSWLNLAPRSDDPAGGFTVNYDKTTPLGEMSPDEDYELFYYSEEGWLPAASERLSTGGFTFRGQRFRLYRIVGPGVANRPFTVELDDAGEVVTLKR